MTTQTSERSAREIDRAVGQRVRIRRRERGISQTELGKRLGLTFQQVQKYEKGSNRISAGRLAVIADILQCPVTTFYGDQPFRQGTAGIGTLERMALTGRRGIDLAETFIALPGHLQNKVADLVQDIAAAAGVLGQKREAA